MAPLRDPAWAGRVFWLSLLAVLLWPLGVAQQQVLVHQATRL